MKKFLGCVLCSTLALIMTPAFAAKVNNLYEAVVPVNSQTTEARNQAIPVALAQVLVKVSGNNQILSQLKLQLTPNENLIQQFSYIPSQTPQSATPYLLDIQFDTNGVNQLLRKANAPIWGANRPLIVTWMSWQNSQNPAEIISSDSTEMNNLIKVNADSRGIPVLLPIMDMTDLNQISSIDMQNIAADKFKNASTRYGANAILIGQVTQNADEYTGQWKLILAKDQFDWTLTAKLPAEMIAQIINNVTNTLSARYAIVTTNAIQTDISLKVTGISQQSYFTNLMDYLSHLSPVAKVSVQRIAGTDIILTISLRSTQQSFIQALAISNKLKPDQTNDSFLTYRWNP